MEAEKNYVEFRNVDFTADKDTVREGTLRYHYRFALDEEAAARVAALPQPLPKGEALAELLLECGAVFHDEVVDGKRRAAVTAIETKNRYPFPVKEAFFQHGLLDDPHLLRADSKQPVSAWTLYDEDTGAIRVQAFWKVGKLNDPAPGIPAVMKLGSVFQSLRDHLDAACRKKPEKDETGGGLAEKYRAYYNDGTPYDPPGRAAEELRNPYDGQCYSARRAGGGYLNPVELADLNTRHPPQKPAMPSAPQPEPAKIIQPKPPFSYFI